MLSDQRTDQLIRQALAVEADRAPTATSVLQAVLQAGGAAVPDASAGQRSLVCRRGVVAAAAAMVVAAAAIPLGHHSLGPSDHAQATPSSALVQSASLPSDTPSSAFSATGEPVCTTAATTRAVPAWLARYERTWVPPGWVGAVCPVYHAPGDPAVSLSWLHPGGVPNFESGLTLTIGAMPQPTTVITQIGPLRTVDVFGVRGTLRVATEQVGSADTTVYDDDLWWSPEPGVVLTVSMTRMPTDPVADLARVARSVAVGDVAAAVPAHLPGLAGGIALVPE